MLPIYNPGHVRIDFDDRRLLANAGLILVATPALRHFPRSRGHSPTPKSTATRTLWVEWGFRLFPRRGAWYTEGRWLACGPDFNFQGDSTRMRPRQALDIYLADYKDRQGGTLDLMEVFQQVRDSFGVTRALYPGSYVHVTPSLVFPQVIYVDSLKGISEAFADSRLLEYINSHKNYRGEAFIKCYQQDYESWNAEPEESFDLLISLNAGFISQAAKRFLRPSGLLLINDGHYDARRAYTDPDYRLLGGFSGEDFRLDTSEDSLSAYFKTVSGIPLTLEMVEADAKRPPSKARFSPAVSPEAYLFEKKG